MWKIFRTVVPAADHQAMLESLTQDGLPTLNFSVLLLASCAIATFGLLGNNAAVIIGAMIIAPLILPIQAFAFGALEGHVALLRSSALTLIAGSCAAVLLAATLPVLSAFQSWAARSWRDRGQPFSTWALPSWRVWCAALRGCVLPFRPLYRGPLLP